MDVQSMTVGRTIRDARAIEAAAEQSRAALAPTLRVICGWDDDTEPARRLFNRVVEQHGRPGGFRSAINEYVEGQYFVSLTECPYAYIALEAASLGITNVKDLLQDDEDDDESRADGLAMLEKYSVTARQMRRQGD